MRGLDDSSAGLSGMAVQRTEGVGAAVGGTGVGGDRWGTGAGDGGVAAGG